MVVRCVTGAAAAMMTLFVLSGCAWFETLPTNLTTASGDECLVLTTALEKIADDWRTDPRHRPLKMDTYAISADRIDGDYLSRLTGLLPPKGAAPVDIGECGTLLASISNRVYFVSPEHGIPEGDRGSCWRSDGGWASRPGIDTARTHAAVLYANDVCGEMSWLVRLTKNARGIWVADPPDPLERSVDLHPQQD
jgi:hypothetical protein